MVMELAAVSLSLRRLLPPLLLVTTTCSEVVIEKVVKRRRRRSRRRRPVFVTRCGDAEEELEEAIRNFEDARV